MSKTLTDFARYPDRLRERSSPSAAEAAILANCLAQIIRLDKISAHTRHDQKLSDAVTNIDP
jgi:hypothetical protein